MNIDKYFLSLTDEIQSLKDRVRLYIDNAHWLSDGEWKESVIRSILRRHLPSDIGVGRGFVISKSGVSTQIDVLLYDKTRPILFQDGEFVLVTPDVAKGAIEVKTKIERSNLLPALEKLANVAALIHQDLLNGPRFFGLFSFEDNPRLDIQDVLGNLQSTVAGLSNRKIHCLSFGASRFIRFWEFQPDGQRREYDKWHAYKLEGKAPAYFIHNVIDHLNPEWANTNNDIWYPMRTKEPDKIADIQLKHR